MTVYTDSMAIISGPDLALHQKIDAALYVLALANRTAADTSTRDWARRTLKNGPAQSRHWARLLCAMDAGIRSGLVADNHTDAAVQAVINAGLAQLVDETL